MKDPIETLKNTIISLAKVEGWEYRGLLQMWNHKIGDYTVSCNSPPVGSSEKPADSYTIWFNQQNSKNNIIGFDIYRAQPHILSTVNGSLPTQTKINLSRINEMWKLRKYFQDSIKEENNG
jgi:hypothetical protein